MQSPRSPEILADTAYLIFRKPSRAFSGHFLIEDTFRLSDGVTRLDRYRVDRSGRLDPNFLVPAASEPPVSLTPLSP